jgi:hypothetical protein
MNYAPNVEYNFNDVTKCDNNEMSRFDRILSEGNLNPSRSILFFVVCGRRCDFPQREKWVYRVLPCRMIELGK